MNINLTGIRESGLQEGDEIAAFDGEVCVGALKISQTDLENNALSIKASAEDSNLANGFSEGNGINLKYWISESNSEKELGTTLLEGSLIYEKQSSVFLQIQELSTSANPEEKALFDIRIYPNPADEKLTVHFSRTPQEEVIIQMTSITGKTVLTQRVRGTTEALDISDLSPGIYLVKIVTNILQKTEKVIII